MHADTEDLRKLLENIETARAEANRLGNSTSHMILTVGLLAVEDRIAEFEEDDARTVPQVEALKRLIGTT